MRIGIPRTIQIFTALLLLSPATASADPPSGMVTFDFMSPIWKLDTIHDCDSSAAGGISIDLCIDMSMTSDGKGKYTGTGMLDFTGSIAGTLTGTASGQMKGKGDAGSAKLETETMGQLMILGYGTFPTSVDFSCSGPVDGTGYLTSNCSLKLSVQGQGSEKVKAFFNTQLMGGPWQMVFDFVPIDEKSFEGSATDSFGFNYDVSGKYNAKAGTSKVSAKGLKGDKMDPDPSNGAAVSLKNMTDMFVAESKTKVAGSKGDEVVQGN